jgi:hypothetical protein
MVEGDGATAEENEGKGEGGQSQGKFVSIIAHQAVVEVHLGDGDRQIKANGKRSYASEQAEQDEQATKEFGEGREIGGPARESEAGDEVSVVVKPAEDLVVSVADDDGAKGEAHDEEGEGLQAIEVAQVVPPAERKIDYSSGTVEGSEGEDLGAVSGAGCLEPRLGKAPVKIPGNCGVKSNDCAGGQLLVTFFRSRIRAISGV